MKTGWPLGTGIDQLCAVAQVSKRTLHQHFTGKDALVAAAVPPGAVPPGTGEKP